MPNQPRKRTVDIYNSAMTNVKASAGGSAKDLNVWAIWSDVTIAITGTLSADNNATIFDAGPNWPKQHGGGNKLGPIDKDAVPGLTYAYTIGKIEARAKLTPAGIGDVIIKTKWDLKRSVNVKAWDNGGHYVGATWAPGPSIDQIGRDDTSFAAYKDLDPSSGNHLDKLYDNDVPGCSTFLATAIKHNSELYANFQQWVTVDLGSGPEWGSFYSNWSYQAQVDVDKAAGKKIDSNVLDTKFITIPVTPFYKMI